MKPLDLGLAVDKNLLLFDWKLFDHALKLNASESSGGGVHGLLELESTVSV